MLGGGTIWVEDDAPVTVQIRMEPDLLPDEEPGLAPQAGGAAAAIEG